MKLGVLIAALVGLAVATAVIGWIGFGAVFATFATIGWRGVAFLSIYSVLPLALLGTAWWVVGAHPAIGQWSTFVWARATRDAGSELLPFSHVGGFVIGARAAILRGVTPTAAYSTTIVDVTTEIIAQLGFTGLGLGFLLTLLDGASVTHTDLIVAIAIGLALTGAGCAALIALQRRGGGMVEKLAERFVPGAAAKTGEVARALHALYEAPWRIVGGVTIHLAAWFASAVGVWLALRLAGFPIGLPAILAIESLVGAARSAAFMAPMGIGVQEASYAVIGPLFGLGPDLSLALSLLKRARDLIVGVPALLVWQGMEGVRLIGREPGLPKA
jgi:putative membrane protein